MSRKLIVLYAVIIGILSYAGWHIYSNVTDLANLSRMPARNSPAPYDGDRRIAKALKIAEQTGKYVLIQSSAQGCGWCHVLHNILTTDPRIIAKIKNNFVYVLVDTTNDQNRDFYKKYANNTDHTLVLIVMNSEGKQLARKVGMEFLEGGSGNYRINPDTLLKFLDEAWLKR